MSDNGPQLDLCRDDWRIPHWAYQLGYARNGQVLRLVRNYSDIIHRAQLDGIENVAPVLLALRRSPAEARLRVGRAVWREVHHSDLDLNVARATVMLRTKINLADVIKFPSGALREVPSKVKQTNETTVVMAGLIASNRTDFREAVMLVRDAIRMGGAPNVKWSMRRLREEHDRLAMDHAKAKADPTPWYPAWSAESDGYKFSLINSDVEIACEAATQRHCVASYSAEAKARKYLIMRIEGRERATVRFGWNPVHAIEVKGRYNKAVTNGCAKACDDVAKKYFRNRQAAT